MKNKRIMVLGAGRGQIGLIQAIKRDGHHCIVTSIPGDYPGFPMADEICYVNIADPEKVAQAAKEYQADAIVTCCLDTGIESLGYTCDQNHLIGLSSRAAKVSNDKAFMKEVLMKGGVNTAAFRKIECQEDLEKVVQDFSFPMVVKAVDLQGSKGVYIVPDEKSLYEAFEESMSETKKNFCIVEEFIDGVDLGAEAFVVNGEILYIMPTGGIMYHSSTHIPVGHYVPLDVDQTMYQKIQEQVKLAIQAAGLDNCAVNVDMIRRGDEIFVVELSGRMGANCLPELTMIHYGIDIYRMIYETALGAEVKSYFQQTKNDILTPGYARMLISEKAGKIKQIINKNDKNDPNIYEIQFFVKVGDEVQKFTNSKDCVGQVIVKGTSLHDCEERIEQVISNIELVLE